MDKEKLKKILVIVFTIIFILLFVFVCVGSCGGVRYIIDNNKLELNVNEPVKVSAEEAFTSQQQKCLIDLSYYTFTDISSNYTVSFISPIYIYYTPGSYDIQLAYYNFDLNRNLILSTYEVEDIRNNYNNLSLSIAGLSIHNSNDESYSLVSIVLKFSLVSNVPEYVTYLSNIYTKHTSNYKLAIYFNIVSGGDFVLTCTPYINNTMYYVRPNSDTPTTINYLLLNPNQDLINAIIDDMYAFEYPELVSDYENELYYEALSNAQIDFEANYSVTELLSWKNFLSAFFDSPLSFFNTLISFDFLGYDFIGIYKFLLSLSLIMLLCRIFI